MCGINGIALASRADNTLDRERLIMMRDCLVHRGPDDSSVFLDRNIGLGHRRLSIVDVAGGIDSSAIAALMSTMVKEPIKTFSVGFAERDANELEYARLVAKEFRTDHHEIVVTAEEYFKALPKLIWHEDEPLAHPASVPLYFVSLLAARHVKVVLTGEGSDEMLAGYYRYRTTIYNLSFGNRYQRFTTRSFRDAVRRTIENMPVAGRMKQKLGRTFLCLPSNLESLYFDNFAVFRRGMQTQLLSDAARECVGDPDPYPGIRSLLEDCDADTLLNQLLYADTKTYLHELLMKQDQKRARARGIFNHTYLRQLVDEHQRGLNHSERLWMLINFEMWQRQFFDCEGLQRTTCDESEYRYEANQSQTSANQC